MTSSPAEGLPVVEFFTLPVRVWAEARAVRRSSARVRTIMLRDLAMRGENCLRSRLGVDANTGSFDFAGSALCAIPATLRMTGDCKMEGPFMVAIMVGLCAARRLWLRVWRFPRGAWRLRPAGKLLGIGSRCRAFCRL